MPKERFHLYLADELTNRCAGGLPLNEIHGTPTRPEELAFYIGAISPDIFFYDLPSFSLTPLGNALHDLIDREGISRISDWIAQTSPQLNEDRACRTLWGLGFACHFLTDALWHPTVNELSGSGFVRNCSGEKRLSEIECHRLLESELEALWLAGPRRPERYDELLEDFKRDRGWLLQIASFYRRFLEFSGLSAGISENLIVKCFLCQNFCLRLFAKKILGRQRDRLLRLPPTRSFGALVTPVQPVLPALFSQALPESQNPFSGYFMELALASLEARLCALAKRLSQYLPNAKADASKQRNGEER